MENASDYLPARRTATALRAAVQDCRGCDLYRGATQAVWGEGPKSARLMLVGEMPGDREDRDGRPFVGPAGALLDEALKTAGIARSEAYVTNVVKHFRWEPRGKRRLHKRPSARQMTACRPWLEAEVKLVQPRVIVCLGATAAQAFLGKDFRITRDRGKPLTSSWAPCVVTSYHPSAILRAPDAHRRRQMQSELEDDLKVAMEAVNGRADHA
jgi:uracil-DNA glycosylase family protein